MENYNQIPVIQPGTNAFQSASMNNAVADETSTLSHSTAYGMQPIAGPSALQIAPLWDLQELEAREEQGSNHIPAFSCAGCLEAFTNNNDLRKHGEKKGHSPYGCICGTKFTRLDALNRHVTSQSRVAPQYPCEYCYNHQGENGFRRRDHLTQHLKVYHKIETVDKLTQGRSKKSKLSTIAVTPTASEAAMPPWPPFQCPVPDCPKMGYDGYLRKVDLDEHMAMMHSYHMHNAASVQHHPFPMPPHQQYGGSGFIP
ncbi:hypothetical protein F4819DRAFT_491202 [Hypoxylon fuscum]|nr:hypothetical protein F4819DRAFT_491202 [Hypoxylon fuscum]